ncbi:MAG: UDP-2,4-diacetamido-2,4,6-trideoxy-beta-L-altropyranose hydrolase [Planctomycetes bacterium]|nr:UDP-2,4-diacetamido-2,4,6-trideoxy-beta-L-altropyranose hydrolase [Planctomycetota bacterium]
MAKESAKKNAFFRCDASGEIGAGHFMRCLALAQACAAGGMKISFLTACRSEGLLEKARLAGAEILQLSAAHPDSADLRETLQFIKDSGGDRPWVVLDGYNFDADYADAIMRAGCRLLRLDDLADQPFYPCDLLANQNIYAADLKYKIPPTAKLLLGTRYALLRREFAEYAGRRKTVAPAVTKILVTLGGSDPNNVTATVIDALAGLDLPGMEVKAVVGPANPHVETIRKSAAVKKCRIKVLTDVSDMLGLMAWADIAVSAAGSTCWELAFMGTPAVLIVTADNQIRNAAGASKAGFAIAIPPTDADMKNSIRQAVSQLAGGHALRQNMSDAGKQIVDGIGAARVAKIIREINE